MPSKIHRVGLFGKFEYSGAFLDVIDVSSLMFRDLRADLGHFMLPLVTLTFPRISPRLNIEPVDALNRTEEDFKNCVPSGSGFGGAPLIPRGIPRNLLKVQREFCNVIVVVGENYIVYAFRWKSQFKTMESRLNNEAPAKNKTRRRPKVGPELAVEHLCYVLSLRCDRAHI